MFLYEHNICINCSGTLQRALLRDGVVCEHFLTPGTLPLPPSTGPRENRFWQGANADPPLSGSQEMPARPLLSRTKNRWQVLYVVCSLPRESHCTSCPNEGHKRPVTFPIHGRAF